jgi:hypothetical protein
MPKEAVDKAMPKKALSFPDRLTGRRVSLALVADGKLPSRQQLYARIMGPLELIQAAAWFFARQSPGMKRHREESPPPLGHMLTQVSPCVPVRVMCGCFCCSAKLMWRRRPAINCLPLHNHFL